MYQVPAINRFHRSYMIPLGRMLFRMLGRITITGKSNIPDSGAYIIAINHISIFDPPFVVTFWPQKPEALGAIEIWNKPGQSLLVRLYGVIPVRRGTFDRKSLQTAIQILSSGYPLVLAPEGGRSHKPGLRRAKPGIAYILEKIPVPVVPVGIVGTTEDFFTKGLQGKRPRLELRIGKPIHFPLETQLAENSKDARQAIADYIMVSIARLLPENYRGVYSNSPDILEDKAHA